MATDPRADGRHARRERNRQAVIDAAFELIQEGKVPPSVDDVAVRAGVSVSSIFRNFDGLADVQRQALDVFHPRFGHLFVVDPGEEGRPERVRAHVRSRIQLCELAGSLLLLARSRALDHQPMVEGMSRLRQRLADQTRERFRIELRSLTPTEASNLAALIDSTTSPEAFDVMRGGHARSSRQIDKTWVSALDALLEQWAPTTPVDTARDNMATGTGRPAKGTPT